MADTQYYIDLLFIFILPLVLAILPVVAQLKRGLWAALFVAAAEMGGLYIYTEFFGGRGLPDGRMGEVMAVLFSFCAIIIGFSLAAIITLIRLVSKKMDERR